MDIITIYRHLWIFIPIGTAHAGNGHEHEQSPAEGSSLPIHNVQSQETDIVRSEEITRGWQA
jgi:hypothetical protein